MGVIPLNKNKVCSRRANFIFIPEDLRTLVNAAGASQLQQLPPLIYFQYGGVNIMLQQSETLHYLSS